MVLKQIFLLEEVFLLLSPTSELMPLLRSGVYLHLCEPHEMHDVMIPCDIMMSPRTSDEKYPLAGCKECMHGSLTATQLVSGFCARHIVRMD